MDHFTDEQWAELTRLCTDNDAKTATLADSIRRIARELEGVKDATKEERLNGVRPEYCNVME